MKNKYSILFITRKSPPPFGGMERMSNDLYRNLAKFFNVKLIVPPKNLMVPFNVIYLIIKTFITITKENVDIIYLQDGMLAPIVLVGKLKKKPIVVSVHGLDVIYRNKLYRLMIKFFLKETSKIFCVSDATRKECIKIGLSPDKLKTIPNGIDPDKWETLKKEANGSPNARGECKYLLSVGRLIERKGFHWFIEKVFPTLYLCFPEIKYFIIGSGKMFSTLEKKIKSLNFTDKVILIGSIDDKKLVDFYQGATVFVVPNIPVEGDMEGFGICNLEAAYFGVPVVASKIDGIPDAIIDGVTGILIEPLDAKSFIDAICNILNDNTKFDKYKMRSTIIDKYSWEKIAIKYRDEIIELLK